MSQGTNSDFEYSSDNDSSIMFGTCYYCGGECNVLSQMCSQCMRGCSVFYDIPNIEYTHDKFEFDNDVCKVMVDEPILLREIPDNIRILIFEKGYSYKLSSNVLPDNIEVIDLSNCKYDFELEKTMFPDSLKVLKMGYDFNRKITEGTLPSSLEELYLGSNYNQVWDKSCIPESLYLIIVGGN
jgi:hypothetical protein